MSGQASSAARQRPTVSKWVVFKLLAFTIAMVLLPISTYFYTLNGVFNGNGTYAAGAAAGMANVVAIGYIVAAAFEEDPTKAKKTD